MYCLVFVVEGDETLESSGYMFQKNVQILHMQYDCVSIMNMPNIHPHITIICIYTYIYTYTHNVVCFSLYFVYALA